MPNSQKIAFITTWNTNVGDDFVREGIRAVLDTLLSYRPYLIDKHNPETSVFSPCPEDHAVPITDKILDADIIIQSGAPVYWNLGPEPGQTCWSSEWIKPLWYDRIAKVYGKKPVLNLAAGSAQGYFGGGDDILHDDECRNFIHDLNRFCCLTTVRDQLAQDIHMVLGYKAHRMPCTSIFAWRRHMRALQQDRSAIALNFMPMGGHFETAPAIDRAAWAKNFQEIVRLLRREKCELQFIAHSLGEVDAMHELIPKADIFFSESYQDYFAVYGRCRAGIVNRVHGGLLLAGSGAPAIIVGNDSRSRTIDEMHLFRYYVNNVEPAKIVNRLLSAAADVSIASMLVQIEADSFRCMQNVVRSALSAPAAKRIA